MKRHSITALTEEERRMMPGWAVRFVLDRPMERDEYYIAHTVLRCRHKGKPAWWIRTTRGRLYLVRSNRTIIAERRR